MINSVVQLHLVESSFDPTPFMPEPKCLFEFLKLPPHIKKPWARAFSSELTDLFKQEVFELAKIPAGIKSVPVMDVYSARSTRMALDKRSTVVLIHTKKTIG